MPRHQRSPRSLRLVAIPRGLNLQKTKSVPRLGPRDLHQNKEGPGHLQSQHTWFLSTRTGFYPLAYIKGEKPTLHRTTKTTQHESACSYKPKIKSCITRPLQEPAKACTSRVRPFISTGPNLQNSKPHCEKQRTASRSCPCQASRKTTSADAHEGPHPSLPEHSPS